MSPTKNSLGLPIYSWNWRIDNPPQKLIKMYHSTSNTYYAAPLWIIERYNFTNDAPDQPLFSIVTVLGGFVDWFLGGLDGFLYALIILVVADYITGVMCAIVDKELSSEIGYRGIFKKVLIFILVGVGHMMDTHLIGDGSVLRTAVIFFYCSNEGISMLENASRLGLPIPEKLKNVLAQLHDKGGNEE